MSMSLTLFQQLVPIRQECFSKTPLGSREDSRRLQHQLCDLRSILLQQRSEFETCDAAIYGILNDMLVAALLRIKKAAARFDSTVEVWLECMLALVSYERWQLLASSQLVQQLVILFSDMIMPPETRRDRAAAVAVAASHQHTPEETQHLAIRCLSAMMPVPRHAHHLYRQSPAAAVARPDLVQALQDVRFRPQISYCVTALLETALKGDALAMRVDAIETLGQLLLGNLRDEDIVAAMLPRIVSTLCRITYQKKEKEHHRMLVVALDVLGDLLVHVLCDDNTPDFVRPAVHSFQDLARVGIVAAATTTSDSNDSVTQEQQRTREWYSTTQARLEEQLKVVLGGTGAQQHSEWRARRAYVRFAGKLLTRCAQTLDTCVPMLLKTMVLHFDDPYQQVATECKMLMHDLMHSSSSSPMAVQRTIVPTLQSNLYAALAALPGCLISSSDERDKASTMALITGYVLILGKRAAAGVLDKGITRNVDGWLAALAVDDDVRGILDEAWQKSEQYIDLQTPTGAAAAAAAASLVVYPKIRFKHMVAERTVEQATRMLNVIGHHSNVGHWIDFFKGFIHPLDDAWQPQAVFVVHALLSGASSRECVDGDWWMPAKGRDDADNDDDGGGQGRLKTVALQTLHDLMDVVIDPEDPMRRGGRAGEVAVTTATTDIETAKVLSICFGLQTVGLLACILEREYMQDELITLLYPLLAHLGSPNVSIHSYALTTLDVIALVCGQRDAKTLAVANCDYVINMVTRRMAVLADNMRGPLVLKALVRIGGGAMTDYLGDTVDEVFDALDRFHMHGWMCAQLCSVLTEIVHVFHQSTDLLDTQPFTHDDVDAATGAAHPMQRHDDETVSVEIREFIRAQQLEQSYRIPSSSAEAEAAASMDDIGRYFLERQSKKHRDDDGGDSDDAIPRTDDDEQIPLTQAEQMTCDILEKARHFLTAPSAFVRSEMLILYGNGAAVLQGRPEKLAPLVATVWPSIMQRLASDAEQHHTVLQAVVCIGRLAESVGDALSRRVDKEAWPKLRTLLQPRQSDGVAQYYSPFSHMSRLHGAILQTLVKVVEHVHLSAGNVPELLAATLRFLDERFHSDLQQHAVRLFEAVARQYPDMVWLRLFSLLGDAARLPSNSPALLDDFCVPEWMRTKDKYLMRNAQRLLDQIA